MIKKFIAIRVLLCQLGLIILLSFFSCNPSAENGEKIAVLPVFNTAVANSEFEGKTPEQKWNYLLKTFDYKHNTSAEFEDWFLEKFETLSKGDYTPDESVVKAICQKFSAFYYFTAGKVFAEYTLYSNDSTAFRSSKNYAYDLMAQYFVFDRQIDSTAKYLAKLEKGLWSESNTSLMISYFNTKAELESLKGNLFEAVINFKKALDHVSEDDVYNRFMLELSIAGMYVDFHFNDKAQFHVDRAYKLLPFDSIPEKFLNTLGVVEFNSGNYERANRIFSRAVQFGKKDGRPEILAPLYANYANLRRREGKFEEALEFTAKSDSICGVNDYMAVGFLINRLNRADIYLEQTRYDEALNELQMAYPDLKAYDILNFNKAYYGSLYKIYDKLGMKALADSNFRLFTEYEKEGKGDIGLRAVSEWELATERERAAKETNRINMALDKEVRSKYLIALILSLLLLFLAIGYLLIYRKRLSEKEKFQQESDRLRQDLEYKSKALLTESINNLTIQNTKEEILGELEEILNRLPDKTKKEFSGLTYRLSAGKDSNFLEEFENRFNGVYESFYKVLLQQAPDLTPNELRICAFIRLNITSKDIARLTGKSLGTLDNTRTFIRKKLNLDSDINLQKFLLDL
ncbi:MAG: hypothetical protein RLZZ241_1725 [Bacteroidota bacterium]|jgi:tetratricopeptide (TPR) repeat protein/DNA-binding CsgD family transcriptional regulator